MAFLVFLPLGLEFYRHPEFFTGHASEVSVFADRVGGDSPLATLASNAWRVLAMFAIAGDREWTHNLAGRPVFDILMAVTYFAGVAIWALRIARNRESEPSERADRNAFVLLAIWAFVMLLPSVLSEAAPNYSRTMPALPALFLAGGLGLTWIVTLRKPFRYAGATLAAAILIYSGSRSAYDYFVVFPAQQEVYYLYDADKLDALEYLSTLTGDNHVYLSQLWGTYHATVSMLRHELGIKSLDTSDTLVLPPQGMGAVYAFPSEQEERAQQLAELWPGIEVRPVPDRFDNVLLHLVEVPPGMASELPPRYAGLQPTPAAFTDAPDLVGQYAATPDKQISLLWSADEPIDASLTSYLHLIDPDGRRVAQVDKLSGNGSYRTDDWTLGEQVLDRYFPSMLDRCAAGVPLRAQVGWYAREEGHAARPRADAPGETASAGALILPILSHDPGYLQPPVEHDQPISAELTFRGYDFVPADNQPGSPVTVDLYWRSDHAEGSSPVHAAAPLTLTLASDGATHVVWSGELAPDSDWDPGEEICRRIRARLPDDLEPGTYRLRAEVAGAPGYAPQNIDLTELDVTPSTRRFDPPPLDANVDAELTTSLVGDQFTLLGANVSAQKLRAADTLSLDLIWQANGSPVGNYKAFVHLVDAAGTHRQPVGCDTRSRLSHEPLDRQRSSHRPPRSRHSGECPAGRLYADCRAIRSGQRRAPRSHERCGHSLRP